MSSGYENNQNDIENTDEEENSYQHTINLWEELEISTDLLRGIYAYGYEKPSPIQKKAILPILHKKDMIAQAQSGTGKTATFTIGALASLNLSDLSTQVLILSPTRELSKQSSDVISGIGSMMKGLVVKNLVGGSSIDDDSEMLKNNVPHIICGCPGRVFDMMRRKQIHSKKIKMFIFK